MEDGFAVRRLTLVALSFEDCTVMVQVSMSLKSFWVDA